MAHLLPPITENYNPGLDPNALNDVEDDNSVLINVDQVKEALKNAGKDVEQFGSSLLPTFAASALGGLNRMSGQDYIGSRGTSRRSSTVSAASIFLELHSPGGSTASSPGPHRAQAAAETDFKAFKRILEAIPQQVKEDQANKKKTLGDVSQWYAMWDDHLTASADSQHHQTASKPDLQDLQEDIFNRLSFGEKVANTDKLHLISEEEENGDEDNFISIMNDKAPFGRYFPEIYLY